MCAEDMNKKVEEILTGAFDLHVHAGPDPGQALRLDALDVARYAQEYEMAGFVLKSHEYPTAPLAHALNRVYPGLKVAGSITLNKQVGGLNPDAVQAAADLDARVVWMPTFGADFYLTSREQGPGLRLTDDSGELLPEVEDILDIVQHRDLLVASGNASPSESVALFKAARSRGIGRMIVTHPIDAASTEELRQMVSFGAYVEWPFLSCMPSVNRTTPEEMVTSIRALGVESCVVTTDFGQWVNPPPAEGMRMAIAALLDAGLEPEEVSKLVKANPLQLVGMEA